MPPGRMLMPVKPEPVHQYNMYSTGNKSNAGREDVEICEEEERDSEEEGVCVRLLRVCLFKKMEHGQA